MRIRGVIDQIQDADVELGYRLRNRIEQLYEAVPPTSRTGTARRCSIPGTSKSCPSKTWTAASPGKGGRMRSGWWCGRPKDFNWRFCLRDADVEFCTRLVMLKDVGEEA